QKLGNGPTTASPPISLGLDDLKTRIVPMASRSSFFFAKEILPFQKDLAVFQNEFNTGKILRATPVPATSGIDTIVAAIDENRFIVRFQEVEQESVIAYHYGCWNGRENQMEWRFSSPSSILHNPVLSHSGGTLAFIDDRSVLMVNTQTGFKRTLGHFPEIDLNSLRFSHDERYLLVVCEDHRIVCYRTDDGSLAWTLPMTGSPAHDAAWSKDQRTILCVTRDGSIKTYDIALQQLTAEIPLPTRDLIRVLLSPDESWIYVLDRTGQVLCVRCNPLLE
ncbi:MAG: WD40 repeat domain-containing protein, partial [Pirellulaceae bacterium]